MALPSDMMMLQSAPVYMSNLFAVRILCPLVAVDDMNIALIC